MINEFAQDVTFVGSSAPVALTSFTFRTAAGNPFNASHVQVINSGGGTIRCSLTTSLTTGLGVTLSTGQTLSLQNLQSGCPLLSLITTSSSTSGFSINVGAWG